MEETRDRITRAAFELHATVGPAQATISAIAERAGVQRHTVYRHFPDIVDLIRACTAHGMEVTGLPQPAPWESIDDGLARLRVALGEMYAYYRANERMIGNILRDLPVMPELAAGSSDVPGSPGASLGHGAGAMDARARRARGANAGAGEHGPRVRDVAGADHAGRTHRRPGGGRHGRLRRGVTREGRRVKRSSSVWVAHRLGRRDRHVVVGAKLLRSRSGHRVQLARPPAGQTARRWESGTRRPPQSKPLPKIGSSSKAS